MANIEFKDLSRSLKEFKQVKKLYFTAFPKAEQDPFLQLRYLAWRKKAHFYAIYADNEWVGLTWIAPYKNVVFLNYIAISEQYRNKGIGSEVLQELKNRYSKQKIFLNIEEPDENAENNEERIKRKQFYERNGFIVATKCSDKGVNFLTLSANAPTPPILIAAVRSYTSPLIITVSTLITLTEDSFNTLISGCWLKTSWII